MKKQLRLYLDTSVFGGYFESKFSKESRHVVDGLNSGRGILITSEILFAEIDKAPEQVREILYTIPDKNTEFVPITDDVEKLHRAYISKKVVPAKSINDAFHVALATVSRADAIISWNFKHIVNIYRIRGYNSINLRLGYPSLEIHSPKEIVNYENEE